MVISKQDIKSVLDNNITYSMVNTITYNLSQLLLKIHNDPVYSVNSDFVLKTINSIRSDHKTNKELLLNYVELSVYLNRILPEDKLETPLFWQRLQVEYYIPSMLIELTPEEKLPEIFKYNKDEINIEDVEKNINKNKNLLIKNLVIENLKHNNHKKIKTDSKIVLHI